MCCATTGGFEQANLDHVFTLSRLFLFVCLSVCLSVCLPACVVSEGQLRHIKTGEAFVFNAREDLHRWNQKRYEALGEVCCSPCPSAPLPPCHPAPLPPTHLSTHHHTPPQLSEHTPALWKSVWHPVLVSSKDILAQRILICVRFFHHNVP